MFVYGFAKSDKANLTPDELKAYRLAAKLVLGLSDVQIGAEVQAGRWIEVKCDDQDL